MASLGLPASVLPPASGKLVCCVFFLHVLCNSDCGIAFPEAFVETWGVTCFFVFLTLRLSVSGRVNAFLSLPLCLCSSLPHFSPSRAQLTAV